MKLRMETNTNLAFEDFYIQFIRCLSWRIKTSIALNIFEKKKKIFHVLAEDPKHRRDR